MSDKDFKNLWQCTKCGKLVKKPKLIDVNYAGVLIKEKVCSECNCKIRLIEIPRCLDKYLNINKDAKYYEY